LTGILRNGHDIISFIDNIDQLIQHGVSLLGHQHAANRRQL
jgi:hypothetical protein